MSRVAIMVRLAQGGTDHFSFAEGSDDPELYPLLSEARAELESTLKDIADAARNGDMEEDHSVADYFLHDTKTNRAYDVAWGPEKADLLVRISHQDALSTLVQALAQPGGASADHEFDLDVAKTAIDFGLVDPRNTVAIVLPSQDGPRSDKTRAGAEQHGRRVGPRLRQPSLRQRQRLTGSGRCRRGRRRRNVRLRTNRRLSGGSRVHRAIR